MTLPRRVRLLSTLQKTKDGLFKTPLYDLHVAKDAKMVDYAGFSMPVLYKGQSHIESHNWVRQKAGLFDVSHMLQHKIVGPGSAAFLEKITPSSVKELVPMSSTLSVLLNKEGGIIDDCIITKEEEHEFYMVTNAACREKDLAFIKKELKAFPGGSHQTAHSTFEGALLALQGPKAAEVLKKFIGEDADLDSLYFGNSRFLPLKGFSPEKAHVARSGYTGEDGFEISIPDGPAALEFASALLELEDIVKPIGLAARDSLRLEAGMCLYGNDLNEQITPVEASLNWVVGQSRRKDGSTFNGSEKILRQVADPKGSVSFKRVGIKSKGPSPRHEAKVFSAEQPDLQVGEISSGSPSPTLGGNVAQAFINKPFNKVGTKVLIDIRGKKREGVVSKMPFVESHFYKQI